MFSVEHIDLCWTVWIRCSRMCADFLKLNFKKSQTTLGYKVGFLKIVLVRKYSEYDVEHFKSPFEGVMIGDKVVDRHGANLSSLKHLFPNKC